VQSGNCTELFYIWGMNTEELFLISEYITHIVDALGKAEVYSSKINNDILEIDGMSGKKTRHFYNNLLNFKDARYLEIGTWKGSSACSAMFGNKAKVFCIDDWSEFGGPKEDFLNNFNKFKGDNDASFYEADCFSINPLDLPKFNMYLFDGNHEEDSHFKSLSHFLPCLDDIFIFIVDDWNWADVRNGTRNAIEQNNLKVLYQKEIIMTSDNSHTPREIAKETWWNGIYICVLKK